MSAPFEKFKALLQWFILLERVEHGHWCSMRGEDTDHDRAKRKQCPTTGYRWDCKGIFCANQEYKDCPTCVKFDAPIREKLESEQKGQPAVGSTD